MRGQERETRDSSRFIPVSPEGVSLKGTPTRIAGFNKEGQGGEVQFYGRLPQEPEQEERPRRWNILCASE